MKTDPVALVVPTEETPSTPGPWLRLGAGLVARNPLPAGTVVVGLGLVVSGLGSYIFLAIVSRALDPERYSSFAASTSSFGRGSAPTLS